MIADDNSQETLPGFKGNVGRVSKKFSSAMGSSLRTFYVQSAETEGR